MFKKILLSAAALSALVLGASQANAGYGYSYGHHHYKPHYRSYSYYKPHCYTVTRPVSIRLWSDYAYGYIFRTVYRDIRIWQLADLESPSQPHAWAIRGCRLIPPRRQPFFFTWAA